MKHILTLIILLATLTVAAQDYSPCYTNNIAKGDAAFKQGKYSEAKTYYATAKQCAGGNPSAAQQKINSCDAKIKAQKEAAEAKRKAEEEATRQRAIAESKAREYEEFSVNGVTFKMIYVEGGTFTMGCTRELGSVCYGNSSPSFQVSLSDFYIGETEVTQALWKAVMGDTPWEFEGDNWPVVWVSWDDCQEFIQKLNQLTGKTFRLPTEAEWEYAARGGNKSQGYKYAGSNTIGNVAWYEDNSGNDTHPVKGKQANELGLYDMSGNVREWCSDWYGSYSSSAQTNPKGPKSGSERVCRGGSRIDTEKPCLVYYRLAYGSYLHYTFIGFRLALDRQ